MRRELDCPDEAAFEIVFLRVGRIDASAFEGFKSAHEGLDTFLPADKRHAAGTGDAAPFVERRGVPIPKGSVDCRFEVSCALRTHRCSSRDNASRRTCILADSLASSAARL